MVNKIQLECITDCAGVRGVDQLQSSTYINVVREKNLKDSQVEI